MGSRAKCGINRVDPVIKHIMNIYFHCEMTSLTVSKCIINQILNNNIHKQSAETILLIFHLLFARRKRGQL